MGNEVTELVQLDVQTLNLLAGLIIPILVGIVAKKMASSGVKATLNFGLSAIAGALSVAIAANGQVEVGDWVSGMIQTFVVSTATYHGFLKPTGITDSVQNATAGFGVGSTGGALETDDKNPTV